MNNRDYKKFGVGEYYHVYNRGNGKQNIFQERADFTFFLSRLTNYLFPEKAEIRMRGQVLPSNSFSLVSYCLMPNHFHFLIRQNTEVPITKLILRLCTSYSKYFNKKYERVGGVFQDQYKMILVNDNGYLTWLSAYIHQNPKTAGLVSNFADYEWSSSKEFLKSVPGICAKDIITKQFTDILAYKRFVDESGKAIQARKDLEVLLIDV